MGWLSVYPLPRAAPLRLFGAAAQADHQEIERHGDGDARRGDGPAQRQTREEGVNDDGVL